MTNGTLEHVNLTVSDADKTAAMLCDLFGWKVRWSGDAMNGLGRTVHVGTDDAYLAVYAPRVETSAAKDNYLQHGGLNHVGIVVDDLDAAEKAVEAAGFKTHSHADYEPGRRFYFHDHDGVEFELVSYG